MKIRTTKQCALLRAKIVAEYAERGIALSTELQNKIELYAQGLAGYYAAPSAAKVRQIVVNSFKG